MAGQDEFPKNEGDIYYPSEASRAALAGRFWQSLRFLFNSGTNYQEAGSVVFGAGSLINPSRISFIGTNDGTTSGIRIIFSGTTNQTISYNEGGNTSNDTYAGDILLGSPGACFANMRSLVANTYGPQVSQAWRADAGSQIVLHLQVRTGNNGISGTFFCATQKGGY